MSYGAFLDLVAGLMESGETPLQQAIYYRTAKCPKETKNNKEYIEAFRARAQPFRAARRAARGRPHGGGQQRHGVGFREPSSPAGRAGGERR